MRRAHNGFVSSGRGRIGRFVNATHRTLTRICSGGICRTRRVAPNTTPRLNNQPFHESSVRPINGYNRDFRILLYESVETFLERYEQFKKIHLSTEDKKKLRELFTHKYDNDEFYIVLTNMIFSKNIITREMLNKYFKFDVTVLLKINKYLLRIIESKESINQYKSKIKEMKKYNPKSYKKLNYKPNIIQMVNENSNNE